MYRSLKAAETAAYEGEGIEEVDSQRCRELQDLLLSSSPVRTRLEEPQILENATASGSGSLVFERKEILLHAHPDPDFVFEEPAKVEVIDNEGRAPAENEAQQSGEQFQQAELPKSEAIDDESQQLPGDNEHPQSGEQSQHSTLDASSYPPALANQPGIRIRRDAKGRLRPFDINGIELRPQGDGTFIKPAMMDEKESTQKSQLSLTQENPESAYEKFHIQGANRGDYPSTATPDDGEVEPPTPFTKSEHHHHNTESTGDTYEENDTGHIALDFVPQVDGQEEDDDDFDEDEDNYGSRDASFAVPLLPSQGASYEPQTPAPALNPFRQKGSVMKPGDMFGATQPSSIARNYLAATPSTSRPSPNVYNDFSSPVKRQRVESSPIPMPDDTPLQSSVRNMLVHPVSMGSPQPKLRKEGVKSFEQGAKARSAEARPYVSMKESQERRASSLAQAESDSNEDSDAEAFPQNRKQQRAKKIELELSSVQLQTKMPRSSSRPSSAPTSSPPQVRTIRSNRRRSQQDNYVAQCEGFDARDTQEDDNLNAAAAIPSSLAREDDDFVADSQAPPGSRISETPRQNLSSAGIPPESSHLDEPVTEANDALTQPSLPLQELSVNQTESRAPFLDPHKDPPPPDSQTVPETSPVAVAEDRLRPMREIANYSFGGQEDFLKLPGFSPDVEFESARLIGSSPPPPQRSRSSRLHLTRASSLMDPQIQKEQNTPPLTDDVADVELTAEADVETKTEIPHNEPVLRDALPHAEIASTEDSEVAEAVEPEVTRGISKADTSIDAEVELPIAPPQIDSRIEPETEADLPVDDEVDQLPEPDGNEEEGHHVVEDARENSNQPETHHVGNEETQDEDEADVAPADVSMVDTPSADISMVDAPEPPPSAPKDEPKVEPEIDIETEKPKKKPKKTYSGAGKRSTKAVSSRTSAPRSAPKSVPKSVPKSAPKSAPKTAPKPPKTNSRPATRPLTRLSLVDAEDEISTPHSTPKSTPRSTPATEVRKPTRSSGRLSTDMKVNESTPVPTSGSVNKRSSKRHSILAREESEDPLSMSPGALFDKMAFAVSYVKDEKQRDSVTKLIIENGGRILQDGFDTLFEISDTQSEVELSVNSKTFGFTALIADEHSRKAKYMQALALNLPCLSGQWVTACVRKGVLVNWSPYLLIAGQSSVLGNAFRSRTLNSYSATDARLEETFTARDKLLEGKSVLFVKGKGKTGELRRAYLFLARALGPARIGQALDILEARKELLESEKADGQAWDILYVDNNEMTTVDKVVFGNGKTISAASKKRKRGPVVEENSGGSAPKRIRVISDETMIQSLILGQLIEE